VILGYPWLRAYYTSFDYHKDEVKFAPNAYSAFASERMMGKIYKKESLSGGAIAGIVIGIILFIVALIVVILCVKKHSSKDVVDRNNEAALTYDKQDIYAQEETPNPD